MAGKKINLPCWTVDVLLSWRTVGKGINPLVETFASQLQFISTRGFNPLPKVQFAMNAVMTMLPQENVAE
jgi:hypothetical protein